MSVCGEPSTLPSRRTKEGESLRRMRDTSVTKSASGTRPLVRYDESVATVEHSIETPEALPLVTLTPLAAAKVKDLMAEEPDAGSLVLRVAIQGGGCSGFQYGLGFDRGPVDGDHELTLHGVDVVVDPFSAPYLRGAKIDFLSGLQESGFKIDNPNASASCGCGHSFTVAEDEELPEGTHVGGCGSGCSH